MPQISWFRPSNPSLPLPFNIKRSFVSTNSGDLELLSAEPPESYNGPRKSPIYFAHGGCGGAAVWLEYMSFVSQKHNIPCYALSCRGRGSSWYPNFIRMFFTTKRSFADDMVVGVRKVEELEKEKTGHSVNVVLVGHSSGGALGQFVLDRGEIKVKGLALLGAIPLFGSYQVNRNWMQMDRWFMPRMYLWHFGHPMSPLSSTALVKQAFFCNEYPVEKVKEFEKRMPSNESFLWPMGLIFRFAKAENVLRSIIGWGTGERLIVIAGEKDRLVDPSLVRKTGDEYRAGFENLVANHEIEAKVTEVREDTNGTIIGNGVRYYEVKGAGHHLQNDLQWEDGAEKLFEFYEQL